MIYLQLFLSFVKVGFTSFGGMSMVPVIMEEMGSHGWMTAEDLSNLIAIAEMTPGPIAVNTSTFAGYLTERLTHEIPEALEFAAALVSLKMETPGPFKGTRQDVYDFIRKYYR